MVNKDIYFQEAYGKLYESIEGGTVRTWVYDGKEGRISHMFIQRSIPQGLGGEGWYDLTTPYGYGGPVIEHVNTTKDELVSAFERAFTSYCENQHIVSEFVRFHPIIGNAEVFANIYNAQYIRNTVGTDLASYDDPIQSELTSDCRKKIRRAINRGVSWRVVEAPEDLEQFKAIYYATMDRNQASEYYYFDDVYFATLLRNLKQQLLYIEAIYEERVIAAGLYLISGDTIHIHLSGTLSEYLYLSPAYVLRYALVLWGKDNGYRIIHHGGGKSNDERDSLYCFKKQFGVHTVLRYYVGRRIWNQAQYDSLCHLNGIDSHSEFFPAYREHI